jgi:hypothetical protein
MLVDRVCVGPNQIQPHRFGFFGLLSRTAPASSLPDAVLARRTTDTLVALAAGGRPIRDAAEDSTDDAHRAGRSERALARAAIAPRGAAQHSPERFLVYAGRPERRRAEDAIAVARERAEGRQVEGGTGAAAVGRQRRVVAIQTRRARITRMNRVGEQLQAGMRCE